MQQPDPSSQHQNHNPYVQYHYKRNRTAEVQIYIVQYLELSPFSETCIWKCTRYGNFLFMFNITSLMSLLSFVLVYSSYLSIFHQLVLYSSTLVAILIKKRPHTTFCAPCEDNGHDVYLAMNRKPGYDFSVSNKTILNSKLSLNIVVNFEEKRPLRRLFMAFLHCLNLL